jgi:hypothetical protein
MQPWPTPALVLCAAVVGLAGACASPGGSSTPTTPAAVDVDPLAGCRLQAGPAAVCDEGRVLLDVASVPGTPAERVVAIHASTDRADAPFQLEAGTPQVADDGGVLRVDVVRPLRMPDVAVGTVSFLAPAGGQAVVSCASFGEADRSRCVERARALLVARVPDTATIQHRPALTLPPDPTCTGTDATFALQRLCPGDVKLSVVGIRGRFGPAAAWWLWHRIVQAQARSFRLVTTCPVLGALGPCAIVDVGDRVGIFGAHVGRDELHLAACFTPPTATGVPAPCLAAFGEGAGAVRERHVEVFDLPLVGTCALEQAAQDTWSRRITCEDGAAIAQFADAAEADAFVATRTTAPPSPARCVVAGTSVPCTKRGGEGATVWRVDVDDPVVKSLVCAAPTPTMPELCRSFLEPTP